MPRKVATEQAEKSKTETKSESKAESKKTKKSKKVEETTRETLEETETEAKPKASRQVPTRETVEKEFDELVASIEEEINKLRESTSKSKGVKFLRSVNKRVKTLKSHALRVSKQRKVTKRNNTNSGFLKPVQISPELAKFTGWDPKELRSRVDVTKYICNYIKEHDLQDPADRRNIKVESDASLKKLLKFDGKDKKPLTYYSLQTYLKGHFVPSAKAEPVSKAEAPAPSVQEEAPSSPKKAKKPKKVKA